MNWSEVFAFNANPRITLEHIGRGRHRVLLVDDFYAHPDEVVALARSLHYVAGGGGSFPGTRAMISLDTRPMIAAISELWGSRLEALEHFHPVIFAGIVNDAILTNNQRQPHIDPGTTALVYLNTPEQCSGGTALYRHRLTGIERLPVQATQELAQLALHYGINPESLKTPQGYTNFQDSIIFNPLFAAEGNDYINDGNAFWEMLYLVEMKFNRLVVVDGRVPHSQHMQKGTFTKYPRVTQTFYLKPF